MKEPKRIPLTDSPRNKEPKKIPLTSNDPYELENDDSVLTKNENNKQNNSQSIQELETES